MPVSISSAGFIIICLYNIFFLTCILNYCVVKRMEEEIELMPQGTIIIWHWEILKIDEPHTPHTARL